MIAEPDYLRSVLESFDGKTVMPLQAVAEHSEFSLESLDTLLSFIENEDVHFQIGASWIILYATEIHALIGKEAKKRIFEILSWDTNWQIALHFLQLFPFLKIESDEASEILPVLTKLTEHKRPFVRAWAYNALYIAAAENPQLRPLITERLNLALTRENASVRARIRNAVRKSQWFKQTE